MAVNDLKEYEIIMPTVSLTTLKREKCHHLHHNGNLRRNNISLNTAYGFCEVTKLILLSFVLTKGNVLPS